MDELVDLSALWDFEDPEGSEARLRAAATHASDGGSDGAAAVLMTQVARALGLQERYDAAHGLLDEISARPGQPHEVLVRVQLERGRLIRSAGRPEDSRGCFGQAAREAELAGLAGLRVDALHMLALTEEGAKAQVRANRAALEVARGSTAPEAQRWTASLLNNLGCALVDAGAPGEALPVFEEAVAEREARGDARETRVARWMVGWTLRLLGRTDEAAAVQRALKQELIMAGEADPYVDEELQILESGSSDSNERLDP